MIYPPLWGRAVEERVRHEAVNLDSQERSPGPVQMCTRCVVTNQRPRIVFDSDGVCSACRYAERKRDIINWGDRSLALTDVLVHHRKTGPYNVVVPASGGKDSSFVAWTLRQIGMRPLLARWAPHITTEIGERNWQSLLHAGFDGVTAQPNGLLHRKLSRLALEYYGDPFIPFIYGQLAWPFHVAKQNNMKLVFFGENGESEYGGDPSADDKRCWDETDYERVYMKGAGIKKLLALGVHLGAIHEDEAICPFYSLPEMSHRKDRPEFHWLGYYLKWHPQDNFYSACENTGFEPCDTRSEGTFSRYASIDDELDGLHYRMAYVKFGIGRCTSDAAQEVRNGELERDEALKLVEKYDYEFPSKRFAKCLSYLGISDERHYENIEKRFA